jgi:hypothetical protein
MEYVPQGMSPSGIQSEESRTDSCRRRPSMIPLESLTPKTFDAVIRDCFYSGLWEHSKCRSELNEREARVLEGISSRSVLLDGIISGLYYLIRRSDLTLRKK